MKRYRLNYNIGKVKYAISYHDGVQKHNDGSDFFGIATFKNKKDFAKFEKELLKDGYVFQY